MRLSEKRIRQIVIEEIAKERQEEAKGLFISMARLYGGSQNTDEELGLLFEKGILGRTNPIISDRPSKSIFADMPAFGMWADRTDDELLELGNSGVR